MRVLLLALKYFPDTGGTATYAHNLALGLQQQGYDTHLLAPSYAQRPAPDREPFAVIRTRCGNPGWGVLRLLPITLRLWREVGRLQPDVVWATSYGGCRALGLMPRMGCKLIGTVHGGGVQRGFEPGQGPGMRLADQLFLRFLRRADAIATVSEYTHRLLVTKVPDTDPGSRTRTIHNGIEIPGAEQPTREAALALKPQWRGRRVLLTVARLIPAKGHDLVIDALAVLAERYPDLCYVIVGDGPQRKALEERARARNVADRIHFTGLVPDAEREMYFALAHIFVLAGRSTATFTEGFGLAYVEAGMRGLPVIGTRVGAVPEVIPHARGGYLIEPDNVAALAGTIRHFLDHEKEREDMGRFAKDFMRARFSLETMAKGNAGLIEQAFAQGPRVRPGCGSC